MRRHLGQGVGGGGEGEERGGRGGGGGRRGGGEGEERGRRGEEQETPQNWPFFEFRGQLHVSITLDRVRIEHSDWRQSIRNV